MFILQQAQAAEQEAFHDPSLVSKAKETKVPSMKTVYVVVLIGLIIGSFATSFTKIILNMGVSSESVTFYRMAIVSLCLAPVCLFNKEYRYEIKHAFSDRRTTVLLMVLGICKLLGLLLAAYGIQYVPILVYNTIWNLNPVFVIILAFFILHEKINPRALVGVCICIIGVLIVGGEAIISSLATGESSRMISGVSIGVVSAFSYALYMVVSRLLRTGFSLPTLMFVLFTIAAILDLGICLYNGVSFYMPLNAALLTIVLALLCTLLSQSLPVWAMRYMSPSLYSLIGLLSIVLNAINAYLLLHEVPNIYSIIGALLLIVGLYVYTRFKNRIPESR